MARITSINAFPPEEPLPNGGGFLSVEPEEGSSVADVFGSRPQELMRIVGMALAAGMGISFSPTSDGGALAVHVFDGARRDKRYVTTEAQLAALLRAIEDHAGAALMGRTSELAKAPARAKTGK